MTKRLAFIDTETTGLSPRLHTVWEVCVIVADIDGPLWKIKPRTRQIKLTHNQEALADAAALEISQFHSRYNVGNCAEDPAEVASWVAEATAGRTLVGSNPAFDDMFLTALLAQHGQQPLWHYRTVDVGALAAGYLTACGHDVSVPWTSRSLGELLDVSQPDHELHTAEGDALWAMGMFKRVMEARPGVARTSLTQPVADMARSYADDGWSLRDFADLLTMQDPAV